MTLIINGERFYYGWGGYRMEDPTCCIEEVWSVHNPWFPYQCSRKRGHGPDGLYCGQHAKKHMEAQ